MTTLTRSTADIGGRRISLLRGGAGREPVLLLHGGLPGVTPYCSGAHVWSRYLPLAAAERAVVAPDLPGFGDSAPGGEPYRVDAMAALGLKLVDTLDLGPCHVVGHDQGGLIAIAMALAAPAKIRSISIVASPSAAPTGDSIENVTLASPPTGPWSRRTQAWALERMSHDADHVDAALLDRCEACAKLPAHTDAVARAGETVRAFGASSAKAKGEFYTLCRDSAFPVPAQIVWGAADPMITVEHGRVLYSTIAQRQTATQFHLINRAGSFPFRETPAAFHLAVGAFHRGLVGAI